MKKSKPWFKAIAKAHLDLYWGLIPFIAILFMMMLFDEVERLLDIPDMMILAAVLYGESAMKLISSEQFEETNKMAIFLFGITAFILTIILWLLTTLIATGLSKELVNIINIDFAGKAAGFLWFGAFFYAISIRVKLYLSSEQ